jgi:branched-chain amino acid transport system ATP-binding protein
LGLAPIIVEKIFEAIVEINKSGTSILLVEQNVLLALEIANKGYVIETGETVLKGDSKDLMGNEDLRKAYLGI